MDSAAEVTLFWAQHGRGRRISQARVRAGSGPGQRRSDAVQPVRTWANLTWAPGHLVGNGSEPDPQP